MSYLPCKNPQCKSHGRPHPFCKCYGEMAAGGAAGPFCSTSRAHQKGCEYFAEGGDVGGTDEEPPGSPVYEDGGTDEEPPNRYEETGQQIAAGVEGVGRGLMGPAFALTEALHSKIDPKVQGIENPLLKNTAELGLNLATAGMYGVVDTIDKTVGSSPEDIAARKEANPGIAGVSEAAAVIGGALTGSGLGGAAEEVGTAIASKLAKEASIGAQAISSAIQSGLIQTSTEASKWALGQGNPEDAVGSAMAIGASAVLGGFLGGAGAAISKGTSSGLKKLAEAKVGERALNFMRGLGFAAKSQDPILREMDAEIAAKAGYAIPKAYAAGAKFFDKYFLPTTLATTEAVHGWHEDGVEGAIKGAIWGAAVGAGGQMAGKLVGRKIIAPAVFKILSSGNVQGFAEAMDHAGRMAQGAKIINGTIEGLFKTAPAVAQQTVNAYGGDRLKRDLDNFIGNGGMTQSIQEQIYQDNGADGTNEEPPGFANGGEVKKPQPKTAIPAVLSQDNGVAIHYPAHNALLSAARGRVSNYLMQLRPGGHAPRLPFDDAPDDRKQKKVYERALSIAVAPMSVMHEIQKGTIEPEHIKHLNAMYPELSSLLQKKATERIVQSQLDGKKPPRHVRQGLSMLLGAPLSQEFTPAGIQAAQSVFSRGGEQPPTTPAPQGQASGGNKSKLSKSDQAFLTGPQARQKRAQRPS